MNRKEPQTFVFLLFDPAVERKLHSQNSKYTQYFTYCYELNTVVNASASALRDLLARHVEKGRDLELRYRSFVELKMDLNLILLDLGSTERLGERVPMTSTT